MNRRQPIRVLILSLAVFALLLPFVPARAETYSPWVHWSEYLSFPRDQELKTFQPRDIAPYIVCTPIFPNTTMYTNYAVDFRVDYLPEHTYLCIGNFDLDTASLSSAYRTVKRDYPGVAGYAGFQTGDAGKPNGVILTIWNTYCTDKKGVTHTLRARQIYPENNEGFEIFDASVEGGFVHCTIPFPWERYKNYRALLQCANQEGQNSRIIFWVCDLETKAWTRLIEFELPYERTYMKDTCAFLENFYPTSAGDVRSMVLYNFRVFGRNGRWIGAKEAYFRQDYDHPGSFNYGTQSNGFWAITTAMPNRCPTPQQNIRVRIKEAPTGSAF